MPIIIILIIAFSVAADQVTKSLIFGADSAFIPGFIRFESVENRGMAWGLLNGTNGSIIILSVLTVLSSALIVFILIRYWKKLNNPIKIGLACILGGGFGNLIDRVFVGFVRDFICTEFIKFPVFNVADAFVTCGAILIIFALVFTKSGRKMMVEIITDESAKVNAD